MPIVQSIATPSQESREEQRAPPGFSGGPEAGRMETYEGSRAETGGWVAGGSQSPLFNEEQLRRIEELQRAAPLLMGRQVEVGRPAELAAEEKRLLEEELERERTRERQRVFQRLNDQEKVEMLEKIKSMETDSKRLTRESEEMKKRNQELIEANQKLVEEIRKMRDQDKKPKEEFGTPAEFEEGKTENPGLATPRREETEEEEEAEKKESPFNTKMMLKGMMKLMEGMQVMQAQLLDVKKDSSLEVVRGGASELEWKAETAPLDLTDWLLTIGPAMGDLSNGSQQWWEATLAAARDWYTKHQEKPPLEKVTHKPEVPLELREPRFQRLEKRATALLMAAIPQTQQEEVIAGKEVWSPLVPLGTSHVKGPTIRYRLFMTKSWPSR